jgi:hypothetical protein
MKLHLFLALSLFANVNAFTSSSGFASTQQLNLPSPSFFRQSRIAPATKLHQVGADFDPEDVMSLGSECLLTPEGYGFSSSAERVLKVAGRKGGFYKAKASERVTDVMEGITKGAVDVALVFDDESKKLLGIFTETDYIKVRPIFIFIEVVSKDAFCSCSTHHFFILSFYV